MFNKAVVGFLVSTVAMCSAWVKFDMNYHCDIRPDFIVQAAICDWDTWTNNDCGKKLRLKCNNNDCHHELYFDDDWDPGQHYEVYVNVNHDCNWQRKMVTVRYPEWHEEFLIRWDSNTRMTHNLTLNNKKGDY